MVNVFFGDSITEGSNCSISFVDYVNPVSTFENNGISGTTIGEYSIYPVDGNSLLSVYNKSELITKADMIFLEYGTNDVSAIMCGFTTLQTVIVSFIKALDGIRQLNPNSIITFLAISTDHDIINKHSELQCNYLKNDYFKGYDFQFPVSMCTSLYQQFIKAVSNRVKVIPMIDDISFYDENAECISDDNLHPNRKGHYTIAETIRKYM